MTRKLLFTAMLITAYATITLFAESDIHRQLIVFRKSGEVNLFYADNISRIELSKYDTDSIEHEEYISQIFHRADGSFTKIPIADIDSVAFGSRTVIESKPTVRRLSEAEANAITKFSDTSLTYPASTPSELIVSSGETVYYDKITDCLPYGLCAKIKSINSLANDIVAEIEYLDPADVFDNYFISETDQDGSMKVPSRISDFDERVFEIDLPRTEVAGTTIKGNIALRFKAELTEGVADLIRHYYHGLLRLHVGPHVGFAFNTDDSGEIEVESAPVATFSIPFLSGAITLGVELNAFINAMAEAGVEYEFNSGYIVELEWTRQNGHDTFSQPRIITSSIAEAEQKIETHLKGEISLGPGINALIGVLFNRIGTGASLHLGPYLRGELSLGILHELSNEYTQENYAKAQLEIGVRLKCNAFTYHRDKWLFGDRVHTKLPFDAELKFATGTHNLFPEFTTRATYGRTQNEFVERPDRPHAIDVATYTPTDIGYPINVGFELSDISTGETFATTIREEDIVEAGSADRQNFSSEFMLTDILSDIDPDKVEIHPIFTYKGHIIKAKPSYVASDMQLSPIIATLHSSNSYLVSGMTPVSQHDYEERTYIEGNLIPLSDRNNKFRPSLPEACEYVNLEESYDITGKWTGSINGENVSFTFNNDNTGVYNDTPFTYRKNSPSQGGISIRLSDNSSIHFYVIGYTSSTIEIITKDRKRRYVLTRL